MKKSFLDTLNNGPLVFDGAMGTQLYERGIFINKCFDAANLSNPDLVVAVHEAYLDAGADAITTNTFAANALKLRRHGLEDEADQINAAGVELALRAAQDRAFVGGSIGPTGQVPAMLTDRETEDIRAAFRRQSGVLAKGGVDFVVLETFRQLSEIRLAIESVREVCDLPIVAQMAFDSERKTADGATPDRVAMLLVDWGADVVGTNCLEGPNVVFDVIKDMVGRGVPVIAQPNAGYPRKVDERLIYMATPEYFGVYARRYYKAGVSIVGGCCGTGPEHVRRISGAARMMSGGVVDKPVSRLSVVHVSETDGQEELPPEERTELGAKIRRVYEERILGDSNPELTPENFVVSVEVNAPSGLDPASRVEAARMLKHAGVDVLNIADGPRASARMSNWALALEFQRELDTEVILHLCGRDRNLLGLQMDVLAYHVVGLHNLVVITGDPPKVGDYPHATAVFDLDSIGILRLIQNFNHGLDPAGKATDEPTRFLCACGAEPAAADYDREIRRLELKVEAGAQFVMTQPVYDHAVLEKFLSDISHLDLPVLVGLLPLASYRNAEFLHNEVPGMAVPEEIRKRMKAAGSGASARAEGVKIAQETLMDVKDRVVGAYIMPPFGRFASALQILECVGYKAPAGESATGN